MSEKNIDLVSSVAQSTFLQQKNFSSRPEVTSDYAKILAEKISEVDSEFEETEKNLSEQQESSTGGEKNSAPETIKRFMPDGSILITTYEGNSVASQIKLRPHLVPVADYSAPPTPSGEPAVTFEAKQSLDLLSLLM